MSLPFDYQLIKSRRRHRTTSVFIDHEGKVIVNAPWWINRFVVEQFLKSKTSWVLNKLKNFKPLIKNSFQNGYPQLFLGKNYLLQYKSLPFIQKARLNFTGELFELTHPHHFSHQEIAKHAKKLFLDWYLKYGKKHISERVYHYTQKLGVSFNKITLKKVSSIWGSCSIRNNLNFNRKLVMAPLEVIDYVVIHEVCHLIHRHHRKSFWDLVASLDPHYKQRKLWLKTHHHLLTL